MAEAWEQQLQGPPCPASPGGASPSPPSSSSAKAGGRLVWDPPCPPAAPPRPEPPRGRPMADGPPQLLQDVPVGRCVAVEITNNLPRVTLRNPRSYCFSGHSHHPAPVQIPPGSVGTCTFAKRSYSLRGSVGVLVYEGDTFSLAIMFSNPFDYNLYYIEFGLKLLPKERQMQSLEDLFREMMESSPPQELLSFQKTKLSYSQSPLQVTMDDILVTATMSNAAKATLTILLEEKSAKEP